MELTNTTKNPQKKLFYQNNNLRMLQDKILDALCR